MLLCWRFQAIWTASGMAVLREVMQDREAPPSVRVKAATSLLSLVGDVEQPEYLDHLVQSDAERMLDSL